MINDRRKENSGGSFHTAALSPQKGGKVAGISEGRIYPNLESISHSQTGRKTPPKGEREKDRKVHTTISGMGNPSREQRKKGKRVEKNSG